MSKCERDPIPFILREPQDERNAFIFRKTDWNLSLSISL